jgi:hypothetical protein
MRRHSGTNADFIPRKDFLTRPVRVNFPIGVGGMGEVLKAREPWILWRQSDLCPCLERQRGKRSKTPDQSPRDPDPCRRAQAAVRAKLLQAVALRTGECMQIKHNMRDNSETQRWMASRSRAYGRNFDTKAESATPTFLDRYFLPSAAPRSPCNPGRLQVMIRLESRLLSVVRAKSSGVGLPNLLCTGIVATRRLF